MLRIVEAAKEWAEARKALLAESVADVRTSESFRAAMERLANAEDTLSREVRDATL